MAKFSCFSLLVGRKNKYKEVKQSTYLVHEKTLLEALQAKLEHHKKNAETDNKLNSTSFSVSVPLEIQGNSTCKLKVLRHKIPVGAEAAAAEAAYEGEDEHDGNSPIYESSPLKRDFTDFDLTSQMANRGKNSSDSELMDNEMNDKSENKLSGEDIVGTELIQSGHISDPGTGKAQFWASPKLKRSCSNLETRDMFKNIADQLSPSRSHSFEDLQHFSERLKDIAPRVQGSPTSVMTPGSADRVMLKKHSSSQVLPSRSRRLWWKLFLWSHRNLHKPRTVKATQLPINRSPNQRGGYSSDTLEPNRSKESRNNSHIKNKNSLKWGDFQSGISGSWPQNQWVAFSTESSTLNRVDEWVNSLEKQPLFPINDEDPPGVEGIVFSPSPETNRSPARSPYHMMTPRPNVSIPDEVLHANSLILSLNSSSTTAHISGMGLKVIPNMSRFSSLKSVNLSGNFIVHITPGSLPKGVHTLNLCRNKIVTIEGLRELTRLRVLDLSYNRISRIAHGLSNCTLIKELYLAGNKISDVEGLHRLLKLTVLDLSFNKITTAKALGQLVANYNSLLALNLLGNPIQNNIGEDQLRKAVSGLLPQLAYLNKQPIKPAREVAMDGVAKAALGNNAWTSRRKSVKRVGQGGSPSSSGHRSSIGSHGQKGRHRSKSGSYQQSPMGRMSSTVASSRY